MLAGVGILEDVARDKGKIRQLLEEGTSVLLTGGTINEGWVGVQAWALFGDKEGNKGQAGQLLEGGFALNTTNMLCQQRLCSFR